MSEASSAITEALPEPGTKRRQIRPKAERRQQLIDATIRCIAQHGLSSVTMQMVTREAGLSVGIANLHFQSKKHDTHFHKQVQESRRWLLLPVFQQPSLHSMVRHLNMVHIEHQNQEEDYKHRQESPLLNLRLQEGEGFRVRPKHQKAFHHRNKKHLLQMFLLQKDL